MILHQARNGLLALACWALCSLPASALPSFAEVRASYAESDAVLLARDGRPLHSKRIDMRQRRLPWTRIEDVSPSLLRALLASEDKKFYEHAGVDWSAAAAGAWRNLWTTRTRGASTLSMQLVGLLDEQANDSAPRHGRRSVPEKISQAAGALWLEQRWKKDEILEAYLNLAGFRGEMVGVAAMSRGLFGKWPDGLDERESALAAALLRAPGASAQSVATRACGVLQAMAQMKRAGPAKCEGLDGLARLALAGGLRDQATGAGWLGAEQSPGLAPHLAQKLLNRPGERLRSTLDADLQRFASASLQRHLHDIARQNAEDGALLVIDNASGEVLAWVGSSGALSAAPEVDGVTALRQAGSTLKPFLYALAFERRDLTAASLLDDSPLAVTTSNGLYVPQNYAPEYRGWVSARMALGGSLNVPAVRTLVRIGPDALRDRLYAFGFKSLSENGDYYGFSLALGSADISLLMLANAYRTLANGGRWSPLRVSRDTGADKVRRPCVEGGCSGVFEGSARQVAAAAPVFIVADILADRTARVGTFGLESWLATPYWSAAKTGTSKDMRDNWCVGFSPRYTVAVWVGNAAGEAMHDVSGVSGAAPVWREVMDWLHRGGNNRPGVANVPPPGVRQQPIRFEPPGRIKEPARQEWFVAGTGMSVVRLAESTALAHIAYPGQGTIIALDPDIPPARQRIALQLSGQPDPGWQWQLDGQPLGPAAQEVLWRPSPGRHRLALADALGRELEAVRFEVRAMKGKRAKQP
ncbi:MAG: penicillin-binding protein 1C [Propionivibrio sp.]|uniref:peptidoglycan glycosyltransferase n=1 Tax=Candidatus Propionivibrio dominans TaxID=2954373 RepID=A0A9D7FHY6_9RHOO|nr:penicillin-binding protein 1C [Candidatus Propionivibrio dominans]